MYVRTSSCSATYTRNRVVGRERKKARKDKNASRVGCTVGKSAAFLWSLHARKNKRIFRTSEKTEELKKKFGAFRAKTERRIVSVRAEESRSAREHFLRLRR